MRTFGDVPAVPVPEFFEGEVDRTGIHVTDFFVEPEDLVRKLTAEVKGLARVPTVKKYFSVGRAVHEYYDATVFPGGKDRHFEGRVWKSGETNPLGPTELHGIVVSGRLDAFALTEEGGEAAIMDVKTVHDLPSFYEPFTKGDVPATVAFQLAVYREILEKKCGGVRVTEMYVAKSLPAKTKRKERKTPKEGEKEKSVPAYTKFLGSGLTPRNATVVYDDDDNELWAVFRVFPNTDYARIPKTEEIEKVFAGYADTFDDYVNRREVIRPPAPHRFLYSRHVYSRDVHDLTEYTSSGTDFFGGDEDAA